MQITDLLEYAIGALIGIIICQKLIPEAKPQTVNNVVRTLIYIAIPCDVFFIVNTIIYFPG